MYPGNTSPCAVKQQAVVNSGIILACNSERIATINDELFHFVISQLQLMLDLVKCHLTAVLSQLHERQQSHLLHVLLMIKT